MSDKRLLYYANMDLFSEEMGLYYNANNDNELSPEITDFLANLEHHLSKLTPRQHEVMVLFLKGKSFRQIAVILSINVSIAHRHFKAAVKKIKKNLDVGA